MSPFKEANRRAARELSLLAKVCKRRAREYNEQTKKDKEEEVR